MPDDLRAVSAVLTGHRLCRSCIALKTDLHRWQVDDAIKRLGAMVATSPLFEVCDGCRQRNLVYTLA